MTCPRKKKISFIKNRPYFFEKHYKKSQPPLAEFGKNITSQDGEDGIIEKILEVIGANTNYCVEFGAWDG